MKQNWGYAKDDVANKNTDNSRNGYTPKKNKSEFVKLIYKCLEIVKENST